MIQKVKYFVFGVLLTLALTWGVSAWAGAGPFVAGGSGYLMGVDVKMTVDSHEFTCSEPYYYSGSKELECDGDD